MAKYLVETYYTCSFKVEHYLDNVDENEISKLEIPTGNPLVIDCDNSGKVLSTRYLDQSRKKDIITNT